MYAKHGLQWGFSLKCGLALGSLILSGLAVQDLVLVDLDFVIVALAGVVIALTICSPQAGTPGVPKGVFAYCGVWAVWIHVGHLLP
jgi:hypothetical protein